MTKTPQGNCPCRAYSSHIDRTVDKREGLLIDSDFKHNNDLLHNSA